MLLAGEAAAHGVKKQEVQKPIQSIESEIKSEIDLIDLRLSNLHTGEIIEDKETVAAVEDVLEKVKANSEREPEIKESFELRENGRDEEADEATWIDYKTKSSEINGDIEVDLKEALGWHSTFSTPYGEFMLSGEREEEGSSKGEVGFTLDKPAIVGLRPGGRMEVHHGQYSFVVSLSLPETRGFHGNVGIGRDGVGIEAGYQHGNFSVSSGVEHEGLFVTPRFTLSENSKAKFALEGLAKIGAEGKKLAAMLKVSF